MPFLSTQKFCGSSWQFQRSLLGPHSCFYYSKLSKFMLILECRFNFYACFFHTWINLFCVIYFINVFIVWVVEVLILSSTIKFKWCFNKWSIGLECDSTSQLRQVLSFAKWFIHIIHNITISSEKLVYFLPIILDAVHFLYQIIDFMFIQPRKVSILLTFCCCKNLDAG